MSTVTSIHRYLDEAFAEVPVTPDSLDLKEELRSNLSARVAELVSGGADDATADEPELSKDNAAPEKDPGEEPEEADPEAETERGGALTAPGVLRAGGRAGHGDWRQGS